MAISVTIKVKDSASPAIRAAAAALQPLDQILMVAGRAIRNAIREHLIRLESERPNQLGGRRTHFYSQAANSVQQPRLVAPGVVVSINHIGIAQRYFGGTIVPRNVKFLTIPANPKAYGKRAREFKNLKFAILPDGGPALIEAEATQLKKGKRKGKTVLKPGKETGGLVMYWLRRSVTQQPDFSVLPLGEPLSIAARDAMDDYISRQLERQSGSSSPTPPASP